MAHGNFKVSYLCPVFAQKIVVSKYYHINANKNFSDFLNQSQSWIAAGFQELLSFFKKETIKKQHGRCSKR